MNAHPTSTEMGWGRGTAPLPQTPSPKTNLGRLHKTLDTPTRRRCNVHQVLCHASENFMRYVSFVPCWCICSLPNASQAQLDALINPDFVRQSRSSEVRSPRIPAQGGSKMRFDKLSWCLLLLFDASTCVGQMFTVTDLGTVHIGDNASSLATGINESGQVVGESSSTEPGHSTHGFRTAPNMPINPVTDDLGPFTSAAAINSSGQVVGTFFTTHPSTSLSTHSARLPTNV
jgi:probable HAF family extracellular repeat protein